MSELVTARWVGPFDAEIGAGLVLKPGDTHEVTEEDLKSAHWERVTSSPFPTPVSTLAQPGEVE